MSNETNEFEEFSQGIHAVFNTRVAQVGPAQAVADLTLLAVTILHAASGANASSTLAACAVATSKIEDIVKGHEVE